jgi:hypothetical protein
MDTGTKIERAAHGPERVHGGYTQINVVLGDHKYEDGGEEEDEPPLLDTGKAKIN